jgi:hypothetical protein
MAGYMLKLVRKGQDAPLLAGRRTGCLISLTLAVFWLGIVLSARTSGASAQPELLSSLHEDICGPISTDDTWTAAQSPFNVTCDSELLPGVTLVIDPGVEIRFAAGVGLTIMGTLDAIGVHSLPITFTSDLETQAPGDWDGLRFVAGSSGSRLAWCVVEYATVGVHIYADPGDTVSPAFSDCAVRHHSQDGFKLEGYASGCDEALAQPTIAGCTVEYNGGCGIYGYGHGDPYNGCNEFTAGGIGGTVSGSEIRQNQASGICLRAQPERLDHGDAWTRIEANVISGNAGHGVHLYGDDPVRPRIENNLIYGNTGAGIQTDAKHEGTDLFVVNNTVASNGGDGMVFNRSALQVYLANNILFSNSGYGLVCNGAEDPQASHNDLWLNAGGNYSGCAPGISDISADPLLLDPAAGDFHLSLGSPCIDAGTSTDAPATDIEGITRPQGGGVDIGAHEHGHWRICLPITLRE